MLFLNYFDTLRLEMRWVNLFVWMKSNKGCECQFFLKQLKEVFDAREGRLGENFRNERPLTFRR